MALYSRKNFFVFFLVFFLFSFFSCDNFLQGSDVKKDIEKAINYANAAYVNLEMYSEGVTTATLVPSAGKYNDRFKSGDSFEVKFEPESNYSFIKWQAEPADSIEFENELSPSTVVKIKNNSAPIKIFTVSQIRPKIVSATPADDSNGVYRDRTLVVKFNRQMDENSIYWTADELKKIKGSLDNAFKVDESMDDDEALYYAYWDGQNPSTYKYKNIEITKYTDSSVNFLQYYGVPKFDADNTRVLRLPTKILYQSGKIISHAPPGATDILVSIKKSFFYEAENKEISLSEDFEWSYYTNESVDSDAPVFVEDENNSFTVTIPDIVEEGEEEQKNYKKENPGAELTSENFVPGSDSFDLDIYKRLNAKNKKLWIRGSFTDVGSGPGSLKWELRQVNNHYFPCEDENVLIQNGQIKLNVTGSNASINPVYENNSSFDIGGTLLQMENLEHEGLYRIDFIASDKNERSVSRSYYFIFDDVPPNPIDSDSLIETRTQKKKITLDFNCRDTRDFRKVVVERKNKTDETIQSDTKEFDSIGPKTLTYSDDEVIDFNRYEYSVKVYDISGNASEEVIFTDTTAPEKIKNFTESRTRKGKADISWTKPSEADFGKVEIVRKNVTADTEEVTATYDSISTVSDIYDVEDFNRYEYKARIYDLSGNASEEVIFTDEEEPVNVENPYEIRNASNSSLKWTAANEIGRVNVECYHPESNELIDSFEIDSTALVSPVFEGLERGKKYVYKIWATDYSGNKTEESLEFIPSEFIPDENSLVQLLDISNSRTSPQEETISWNANPSGEDVDYVRVEQRYNGELVSSWSQNEDTSVKTCTFGDLTNQQKYEYRFYSVNYSGIKSTNYTSYSDNIGPVSLVSISNISSSRTSAEKETVRWSSNPTASMDIDHIVIEQYDGTILNNTFTQSSASIKTADFAGCINQHKYTYRFYSVDYSGNKSSSYTKYQDNTPPAPLKIRYSEGRNGKINVFFTTPNDEDYACTKVRYGSTDGWEEILGEANGRNVSSYGTFKGAINGVTYYYYFRTYDYSGNCSDNVYLEEMGGAMPGMICYAPGNDANNIFCSKNYYAGKNPIGIVADGTDQSKVKILASDESQSYTYGEGHSNFCADNAWHQFRWDIYVANGATAYYNCQDGLEWYKTVRDMADYKANANGTYDQYGTWRDSIWTYAMNKNKKSAVTWWIPARHEWQYVCWNWKPMCSARDVLKNNNESFANISNNTKYYVATPNYYTSSCNMVGINYNDNGNMNEYLANGEWMNMYTTSYRRDAYARSGYYGAYTRCMAFVNMN